MTSTVADVLHEARGHLYGQRRPVLARLNGAVTNSTQTLNFHDNVIRTGDEIALGAEVIRVWAATNGNVTAATRGHRGSTAAAHSDGAIAEVNPMWSDFDLMRQLNNELRSLSSPSAGLYKVTTTTFEWNTTDRGYNLTGATDDGVIDILEVKYDLEDATETWPTIPREKWVLKRQSDTTDFATGLSLVVYDGGYPGTDVRVTYKAPFSTVSALTDNLSTTGVPSSAYDILALGVAMRVLAGWEASRQMGDQGETRRADEQPSGARIGAWRALQTQHALRVAQERSRLAAKYPTVLR